MIGGTHGRSKTDVASGDLVFQDLVRALCVLLIAAGSAQAQSTETMKAPSFGTVTIYSPAPSAGPPKSVVLFISGDGGWNRGVIPMGSSCATPVRWSRASTSGRS